MANCLKCTKQIPKLDDKNPKIVCHGCDRQICVKCSGLLVTELRVIALQSPTLKYLCPDCEQGVRQLPALRKLVDELKTEVDALRTSQPAVNVEAIIDEIEERNRRASNVIMFGVPELHADGDEPTSVEARKIFDQEQVEKALASLPEPVAPVALIRLGKPQPGSGPRPIKLVLPNRKAAIQVLKNGKKLRGVTAKNDLTPCQRDHLKNLRRELTQRIEKGEDNLTIRYVNNKPIITTHIDETTKKS